MALAFGVVIAGLGFATQFSADTILSETVIAAEDGKTFTTREFDLEHGLHEVRLSASGVTFMIDWGFLSYRVASTADASFAVRGRFRTSESSGSSRRLRIRGEKTFDWSGPSRTALVVTIDRKIDEPVSVRVTRLARDHRILKWTGLALIGMAVVLSPKLRDLIGQLVSRTRR